jgi:hypothetical protein
MKAHNPKNRKDDWITPKYIFDALGETFDLDVAAPEDGKTHVPTSSWYFEDAIEKTWRGFVWMNPPFGHQSTKRLWLSKFFDHGNGIALLPDRTSAPWWQEFAPRADAILFASPKIKFERADGTRGEQPGDGTTLIACGRRAASALVRAESLGSVFVGLGDRP